MSSHVEFSVSIQSMTSGYDNLYELEYAIGAIKIRVIKSKYQSAILGLTTFQINASVRCRF